MNNAIFQALGTQTVFARGGGGGSHSGGGGHSGGSYGGSSYGSSGGNSTGGLWVYFVIFGFIALLQILKHIVAKRKKRVDSLPMARSEDPLEARVTEVFNAFQDGWSNFKVEGIIPYLTDEYYRRIVLELNVLHAMNRQNVMKGCVIHSIAIPTQPEGMVSFVAQVKAVAQDVLLDTKANSTLYMNSEPFTEYWSFISVGGVWKLDLISQETEASELISDSILQFAKRNGFFFDPDFGSLMLPEKGALFSQATFATADINNHVIGFYRNKIVEFYTYQPQADDSFTTPSYVVAQVVLPSQYRDILISRRGFWSRPPKGMVERTLESPDFTKKFTLYSDPLDQVSSWVLLTPSFMERLTAIPFEINIEVIGNCLYFYTKDSTVEYDTLLEVVSWAFDELK